MKNVYLVLILVVGWGGIGSLAKRHRSSNPVQEYGVGESEKLDKNDGELWYPLEDMNKSGNSADSDALMIGAIKDLFLKWGYDLDKVPKPFGNLESSEKFRIEQPELLLILETLDPMPKNIRDVIDKILAQQKVGAGGDDKANSSTSDKKEGRVVCEENYLLDRIFPKLDLVNKLISERNQKLRGAKNGEEESGNKAQSAPSPLQMEKLEEILETLKKESDMERKLEQSLETIATKNTDEQGYDKQPTPDVGPLNVLLREIQMIETQMKEAKEHEDDFAPTFQKINDDLASLAQFGNQIRDMQDDTGSEQLNKISAMTAEAGDAVQQKENESKFHKANNEIKEAKTREHIKKIDAQQKTISDLTDKAKGKQMDEFDEHKNKLHAIEKELAEIAAIRQKFAHEQQFSNYDSDRDQDNLGKIDDQMTELKHSNQMAKIDRLMNSGPGPGHGHEEPNYYPRYHAPSPNFNQLKEHRDEDKNQMIISALRGTPEFPSPHRSKTGTHYDKAENDKYFKRLRQKMMMSKKNKRVQ